MRNRFKVVGKVWKKKIGLLKEAPQNCCGIFFPMLLFFKNEKGVYCLVFCAYFVVR
jgi:hypothetical protein